MSLLRSAIPRLLALGIGVLTLHLNSLHPTLTKIEHSLFLYPERLPSSPPKKQYLKFSPPPRLQLEIISYQPSITFPTSPTTSFIVDSETFEILGSDTPSPAQWAYLLQQSRQSLASLAIITTSLSWPDADQLSLATLQHEIDQFPKIILGLTGQLTGQPQPLPLDFQPSVLTGLDIPLDPLPALDSLPVPPSITAPLIGITQLVGHPPLIENQTIRTPLLYRWGQKILPSIHLAALLAQENLSPVDVSLASPNHLRLGPAGPVLEIDPSGATLLDLVPNYALSPSSAATLLTQSPDQKSNLILLPQNAPPTLQQLARDLRALARQTPTSAKIYQPWPHPAELLALTLFALFLRPRKNLLLPLAAFLIFLTISLTSHHWLPTLPFAAMTATTLLIKPFQKTPPPKKETPKSTPKIQRKQPKITQKHPKKTRKRRGQA